MAILLGSAIISDLAAIEVSSKLKTSGSFLALVLAMVFLGATPAAIIGITVILVGWLRWPARRTSAQQHPHLRCLPTDRRLRLCEAVSAAGSTTQTPASTPSSSPPSFSPSGSTSWMIAGRKVLSGAPRSGVPPLLPSELAAALMSVGIAYLYVHIGDAGVALFGVVLVTVQYLLGPCSFPSSARRNSRRTASSWPASRSACCRRCCAPSTCGTNDRPPLGRGGPYSRTLAERIGLSRPEVELIHIAGLLHDIGKFGLPDRILAARTPLEEEDWKLIKRHPRQGANFLASLDGYGPVAEIILAHHERIDGKDHSRGLSGDQIPMVSRIISIADSYDAMTASDTYRTPISHSEAIAELRRVAGTQLDAELIEVFIALL